MFGIGKKKNPKDYDDEYAYDEYGDGYDYDDYDDYDEQYYERDERSQRGRPRGESLEEYTVAREDEHRRLPINAEEDTYKQSEDLERGQAYRSTAYNDNMQILNDLNKKLTEENNNKDVEIKKLTEIIADFEEKTPMNQQESSVDIDELNSHIDAIEKKNEELRKQVAILTEDRKDFDFQLAQKEAEKESIKTEIADILMDYKKQNKEILSKATYEAEKIIADAREEGKRIVWESKLEIQAIQQELDQYRNQVAELKNRSNDLFDEILSQADSLGELPEQ